MCIVQPPKNSSICQRTLPITSYEDHNFSYGEILALSTTMSFLLVCPPCVPSSALTLYTMSRPLMTFANYNMFAI